MPWHRLAVPGSESPRCGMPASIKFFVSLPDALSNLSHRADSSYRIQRRRDLLPEQPKTRSILSIAINCLGHLLSPIEVAYKS